MKVLVATKEGQGKRSNDFFHTIEGEPVKFGFECDGEMIDGNCGCKRSMVGTETLKATTTFKVVDTKITKAEFINRLKKSYQKGGWYKLLGKSAAESRIGQEAYRLLRLAKHFKIGKILEKRGNQIQERNI